MEMNNVKITKIDYLLNKFEKQASSEVIDILGITPKLTEIEFLIKKNIKYMGNFENDHHSFDLSTKELQKVACKFVQDKFNQMVAKYLGYSVDILHSFKSDGIEQFLHDLVHEAIKKGSINYFIETDKSDKQYTLQDHIDESIAESLGGDNSLKFGLPLYFKYLNNKIDKKGGFKTKEELVEKIKIIVLNDVKNITNEQQKKYVLYLLKRVIHYVVKSFNDFLIVNNTVETRRKIFTFINQYVEEIVNNNLNIKNRDNTEFNKHTQIKELKFESIIENELTASLLRRWIIFLEKCFSSEEFLYETFYKNSIKLNAHNNYSLISESTSDVINLLGRTPRLKEIESSIEDNFYYISHDPNLKNTDLDNFDFQKNACKFAQDKFNQMVSIYLKHENVNILHAFRENGVEQFLHDLIHEGIKEGSIDYFIQTDTSKGSYDLQDYLNESVAESLGGDQVIKFSLNLYFFSLSKRVYDPRSKDELISQIKEVVENDLKKIENKKQQKYVEYCLKQVLFFITNNKDIDDCYKQIDPNQLQLSEEDINFYNSLMRTIFNKIKIFVENLINRNLNLKNLSFHKNDKETHKKHEAIIDNELIASLIRRWLVYLDQRFSDTSFMYNEFYKKASQNFKLKSEAVSDVLDMLNLTPSISKIERYVYSNTNSLNLGGDNAERKKWQKVACNFIQDKFNQMVAKYLDLKDVDILFNFSMGGVNNFIHDLIHEAIKEGSINYFIKTDNSLNRLYTLQDYINETIAEALGKDKRIQFGINLYFYNLYKKVRSDFYSKDDLVLKIKNIVDEDLIAIKNEKQKKYIQYVLKRVLFYIKNNQNLNSFVNTKDIGVIYSNINDFVINLINSNLTADYLGKTHNNKKSETIIENELIASLLRRWLIYLEQCFSNEKFLYDNFYVK